MPEVWAACFDFAQQIPAHEWQPEQARQLLYLTARDNESEYIAGMLPESALLRRISDSGTRSTVTLLNLSKSSELYSLHVLY